MTTQSFDEWWESCGHLFAAYKPHFARCWNAALASRSPISAKLPDDLVARAAACAGPPTVEQIAMTVAHILSGPDDHPAADPVALPIPMEKHQCPRTTVTVGEFDTTVAG